MSAENQYNLLLEKISSQSDTDSIEVAYAYAMQKTASKNLLTDIALATALGAPLAYMAGRHTGKSEEKKKHKNYALAGAGAGALIPYLIKNYQNPMAALNSEATGFTADDILSLKLEDFE
tara:strand:- start:7634 stop:7993 length:360 start_codon:yes stop_codon:yes gene_type:complete